MNLANVLIPIFTGSIILIAYVLGLIYFYRRKETEENLNWKTRLEQVLFASKQEKSAALSLIKDDPANESYFHSKLPKVEGLRQWIQHAGFDFSPIVLLGGAAGLGVGVFFVLFVIFHISLMFSVLVGLAASLIIPWGFLTFFRYRQKKKFMVEFPIALDIMRRALRAGYSADRALEMVAEQQTNSSIGKAFRMIGDKMRLGESVETVLTDMSNRIGIDEFRMLAIVFVLQRETGGSLAEAAENFSKIIHARTSLRKKIASLTAEVRVTAVILSSIPFFIMGAVYVVSPKYLDPLFITDKGKFLLMIGTTMLISGIVILIRMSYKDIY
ncbi:MAG: type II secretion system F family protein [Proteobacteria bacterium]|nr:type II secretion system F family protein [Pseudomonadota bacterium]